MWQKVKCQTYLTNTPFIIFDLAGYFPIFIFTDEVHIQTEVMKV